MVKKLLFILLSAVCIAFGADDEEKSELPGAHETGQKRKASETPTVSEEDANPPAKKQKTEKESEMQPEVKAETPEEEMTTSTQWGNARKISPNLLTLIQNYPQRVQEFQKEIKRQVQIMIDNRYKIYQKQLQETSYSNYKDYCIIAFVRDAYNLWIHQAFNSEDSIPTKVWREKLNQINKNAEFINFIQENYDIIIDFEHWNELFASDKIAFRMIQMLIELIQCHANGLSVLFILQRKCAIIRYDIWEYDDTDNEVNLLFRIIIEQHRIGLLDPESIINLFQRNKKDDYLSLASINSEHLHIIDTLLTIIGCDGFIRIVEFVDKDGENSFHDFCSCTMYWMFEKMYDILGTNQFQKMLEVQDKQGRTPLHHIINNHAEHIITTINDLLGSKTLIELLKIQDNQGNTLLHLLFKYSESLQIEEVLNCITEKDFISLLLIKNNEQKCILDYQYENRYSTLQETTEDFRRKLINLLKTMLQRNDLDLNDDQRKNINHLIALLSDGLSPDKEADGCNKLDFSSTSDDDDDDTDGPADKSVQGNSTQPVINLYFNPDGTRNLAAEQAANQGNTNQGTQQLLSVNAVPLQHNIDEGSSWARAMAKHFTSP